MKKNGYADFEFDEEDIGVNCVKPPRPFVKRDGKFKDDQYDIHDMNAPEDESTDTPTKEFHRCVRQATGYPIEVTTMEDVTSDGGVKKRILKMVSKGGANHQQQVKDGCRVWIHYDVYLDNGPGKPLILHDSTADHGMAASFQVGNEGLPGLQYGLKTMRQGEIAEFAISPAYGYGEQGIIGFIGKNQSLRIIVELREMKQKHRKPMSLMTEVEKKDVEITFDDVNMETDKLIRAGKTKFENGLYRDACDRYNWGLDLLRDYRKISVKSGQRQVDIKSFQIYSNLALCFIRLEDFEEAEKTCELALELRHHSVDLKPKVLYRQALAMFKQEKFEKAKEICARALRASSFWGHAQFRDLQYKVRKHEYMYVYYLHTIYITPLSKIHVHLTYTYLIGFLLQAENAMMRQKMSEMNISLKGTLDEDEDLRREE